MGKGRDSRREGIRIDTGIRRIRVEIEGRQYALAEKTERVADALISRRRQLRRAPEYRLWRAELRILLGRGALRRIFPAGKRENLDRMQRIHAGVLRAFEYNAQVLEGEQLLSALLQGGADERVVRRGDGSGDEGR